MGEKLPLKISTVRGFSGCGLYFLLLLLLFLQNRDVLEILYQQIRLEIKSHHLISFLQFFSQMPDKFIYLKLLHITYYICNCSLSPSYVLLRPFDI